MSHTRTFKILSTLALFALLALTFATPARAFDSRTGENVVIAAGEIVEDDLYVSAATFILDGTVKGDLVVAAQTITINGTVVGDLLAGGQAIIVNGTVTDDVRMAGNVLFIGENASIGDDLVSAGYSLEARPGSAVGGDVVYAGGQILLAGDVTGNVTTATGGLELRGIVGGNVNAEVGEAEEGGYMPTFFMPTGMAVPTVHSGLTIDPAAEIGGDLKYTQTRDLSIPGGVVGGQVTRTEPEYDEDYISPQMTTGQIVGNWAVGLLRRIVTLILVGLLLACLAPKFVPALAAKIQSKPWPSLGWGVVAYAAFIFTLLVIFIAMIIAALIFGYLTLSGLTSAVIFVGLLVISALILTFVLATAWLTYITMGTLIGKLILNAFKPGLGEHKVWPMVLGIMITALVIALFNFPLLPFNAGWMFSLAVLFFGLGALWLWGREAMAKRTA